MLDLAKMRCEPRQLSALTLAFVGDAVYELLVREQIVAKAGSMPPRKLHQQTVRLVKCSFQAKAYEAILSELNEEEIEILRRGRNSSGVHPPKNADMQEYRKATGLEALFGYWYLSGQLDRMNQFFDRLVQGV